MNPPDDSSIERLSEVVRRIVSREIDILDKALALSDDDVKRLAMLSLVLQRIRTPAAKEPDPENPAAGMSHEQLMRRKSTDG